MQALERTQPGLPLKKGRLGTMTHNYKGHGHYETVGVYAVATVQQEIGSRGAQTAAFDIASKRGLAIYMGHGQYLRIIEDWKQRPDGEIQFSVRTLIRCEYI
jgi:M42 glutamyl aminopeptidase